MTSKPSTQPHSGVSALFAAIRNLLLAACLFLAAGCQTCPPSLRPTLPTEPHPVLTEVDTVGPDDPAAEYCISDQGRIGILTNLELYRGALDKCNETINRYNATIIKEGE